MGYDPAKHDRRSIRLKHFDYSMSALYFVTLCTAGWRHVLGRLEDGILIPSQIGRIVSDSGSGWPSNIRMSNMMLGN